MEVKVSLARAKTGNLCSCTHSPYETAVRKSDWSVEENHSIGNNKAGGRGVGGPPTIRLFTLDDPCFLGNASSKLGSRLNDSWISIALKITSPPHLIYPDACRKQLNPSPSKHPSYRLLPSLFIDLRSEFTICSGYFSGSNFVIGFMILSYLLAVMGNCPTGVSFRKTKRPDKPIVRIITADNRSDNAANRKAILVRPLVRQQPLDYGCYHRKGNI
ncbi:hypothetical protein JTE90_025402 [Oedothorax gibbosus]|uniref:Uncharacterized protein n=1 Tax=Oedothorax gibbosus TaxID=931172 RepID=A0AAV6UJ17_9ARAC|nr:hypothetical protein JTE90_025402 [Oedothorax gibbosus]